MVSLRSAVKIGSTPGPPPPFAPQDTLAGRTPPPPLASCLTVTCALLSAKKTPQNQVFLVRLISAGAAQKSWSCGRRAGFPGARRTILPLGGGSGRGRSLPLPRNEPQSVNSLSLSLIPFRVSAV